MASHIDKDGKRVTKLVPIPFNFYGKAAENAMSYEENAKVKIQFDVDGSEYNGKFYPRLRALKVESVNS